MDYKGGIAAANKLLDLFKDGFKDYVMRIGEFNNIDSILHSMGIKFQNGKVDRLNDKKDLERINEVVNKFDRLIGVNDANIYTNGKINSESEIKEEIEKIKNIFYGSGEKVKILDFKGTVEKNPYDLMRSIDDRIDKISNLAQSVCNDMINNARTFMKQLEDLAKRIDETGEENSTVSGLIYAFANKYMKIINKISTALKSQTSVLGSITSTVTNAAISADKIGTTLGDINTTDFILKQYESYNDYDGMNWLRDILFE
jgi:archaellum component FlaC